MSSSRMQHLPADVADDVHHLRFAGALAALVDDGERGIDALGERPGAHHAADVRRHHHEVGEVVAALDVAHHGGGGEQVVGGNVEEALDLPGMEVQREHPVGAGALDQVGDELGRDGRARARLSVLAGVAEIGDDRRHPARRGPPQGIDQDEQFHQMVVGRKRRRLDDERVFAAHVLQDLDEDLHVGEAPDRAFGERHPEIGRDGLRQRPVGIACQELHRSHCSPLGTAAPPRSQGLLPAPPATGQPADARAPQTGCDGGAEALCDGTKSLHYPSPQRRLGSPAPSNLHRPGGCQPALA
jgi:hypothetical protein